MHIPFPSRVPDMRRPPIVLAAALAVACSDPAPGTTPKDTIPGVDVGDTDTDADSDSDTDADTDTDSETAHTGDSPIPSGG